jgi:hypothetical protein
MEYRFNAQDQHLHQVGSDPEHQLTLLEAQLGNVAISSYHFHLSPLNVS